MLSIFRRSAPEGPPAAELLARAQQLHADARFSDGVEAARRALARREQEVGESDPSLVPFLLTYAGLLYLTSGWSSGRPHYDRAQQLRLAAPSVRVAAQA